MPVKGGVLFLNARAGSFDGTDESAFRARAAELNLRVVDLRPGVDLAGTVRESLAAVHWPGRFERIATAPDIYVDGAHNVNSIERLAATAGEHLEGGTLHVILGNPLPTAPCIRRDGILVIEAVTLLFQIFDLIHRPAPDSGTAAPLAP